MLDKSAVATEYTLDRNDCVANPGKFAGEHWSSVALYDLLLDGGSDDDLQWSDNESEAVFIVDNELRRAFGLGADVHAVSISESSQGFVTQTSYTADEYDSLMADYEAATQPPEIHVYQLTAHECAAQDNDLVYEYLKRREFRLAAMNSRTREAMLDTIVAEQCIKGGWFYRIGDDGFESGPFATARDARNAAENELAG